MWVIYLRHGGWSGPFVFFLLLYCCNHNHFWFPQGLNSWQKDHLPDLPLDHFRIRMMPPSQMLAARGAGFNRWILPRNEIYICKHPNMLLYVCFFSVPTYITTSSMDFCSISSGMRGSKGTTTMLVISYLCLFMSIQRSAMIFLRGIHNQKPSFNLCKCDQFKWAIENYPYPTAWNIAPLPSSRGIIPKLH